MYTTNLKSNNVGRLGADSRFLKKGDLVEFKGKIWFSGTKNFHSVTVLVNGDRYRSEAIRGNDYIATGLRLIEDRIPFTGSPTSQLWAIKDIGVQVISDVKNVTSYNGL